MKTFSDMHYTDNLKTFFNKPKSISKLKLILKRMLLGSNMNVLNDMLWYFYINIKIPRLFVFKRFEWNWISQNGPRRLWEQKITLLNCLAVEIWILFGHWEKTIHQLKTFSLSPFAIPPTKSPLSPLNKKGACKAKQNNQDGTLTET